MLESEQAISDNAANGPLVARRVCAQLLSEPLRYGLWRIHHERRMNAVARARFRRGQVIALRAFALEQIHRSALVCYLRDHGVVGDARDGTLRRFLGTADSREAALAAHRDFLFAAASQICALELLELANDIQGVELLVEYQQAYGDFFRAACESARAKESDNGQAASGVLHEARAAASRVRRHVLEGDSPRRPRSRVGAPLRERGLSILSHRLVPRAAGASVDGGSAPSD